MVAAFERWSALARVIVEAKRMLATLAPRILYAIALAPAAAAGCGDSGGDSAAAAATLDTVNGVERIRYGAADPHELPWTIDTVAVIGRAFGAPEYQFSQVNGPAGLASDGRGTLYVLDGSGDRILAYDSLGVYVGTYGRTGGGPGEFERPGGLGMGPGDTLWVFDGGADGFVLYPTGGGEPREIRISGDGLVPVGRFAPLESGFLQMMIGIPGFSDGAPPPDEGVMEVLLARFDAGGAILDTARTRTQQSDQVRIPTENGFRIFFTAPQFEATLRWTALPNGTMVVADSADYVLHFMRANGTPVRRVAVAFPPRRVTEELRDRTRALERQSLIEDAGGDADQEYLRRRLEAMTFADVVPRVTDLAVDPADRLWVGVSLEEPNEPDRIDVYSADGLRLGGVTGVPFPQVFLAPGLFGRLEIDQELGTQRVVVYRLHESRG